MVINLTKQAEMERFTSNTEECHTRRDSIIVPCLDLRGMETFRDNLKRLLKAPGSPSQRKVASALGITHPTITSWINGPAYPQVYEAMKLAEVFRVPLLTLLYGNALASPATPPADAYGGAYWPRALHALQPGRRSSVGREGGRRVDRGPRGRGLRRCRIFKGAVRHFVGLFFGSRDHAPFFALRSASDLSSSCRAISGVGLLSGSRFSVPLRWQ